MIRVKIKEWRKINHSFRIYLKPVGDRWIWQITNSSDRPIFRQKSPPYCEEDEAFRDLLGVFLELTKNL